MFFMFLMFFCFADLITLNDENVAERKSRASRKEKVAQKIARLILEKVMKLTFKGKIKLVKALKLSFPMY